MARHTVDFATIETTKGPRSTKARIFYEGSREPLKEVSAKTEAEALEKARAWFGKLKMRRLLMGCVICGNGVELIKTPVKGKPYKFELSCGACLGISYRGNTSLEWPG